MVLSLMEEFNNCVTKKEFVMKKTNMILMSFALGVMVFASAKVDMVKSLDQTNANDKIALAIDSEQPVYGLQFEMKYNPEEIAIANDQISAAKEGFKFDYRIFDQEGKIRALMFSLEGIQLTQANEVSGLVDVEFEPVNGFNGNSTVQFTEFILAGENGESIEVNASSFEVAFDNIALPEKTDLSQNYPNPFNPVTTIDYQIADEGFTSLVIYNLNGAEVKTLLEKNVAPGSYSMQWDGTNNSGENVSSGRYILKMTAKNYTNQLKMTLLK